MPENEVNIDTAGLGKSKFGFVYKGKRYALPPSIKMSTVRALRTLSKSKANSDEDIDLLDDVLEKFLGPSYKPFMDQDPDLDEIMYLMEHAFELYGKTAPK